MRFQGHTNIVEYELQHLGDLESGEEWNLKTASVNHQSPEKRNKSSGTGIRLFAGILCVLKKFSVCSTLVHLLIKSAM